MSAKTYALMSADELIGEFIRVAKSLSSLWTFWFKTPKKTPEREEMNHELKAISAELRARADRKTARVVRSRERRRAVPRRLGLHGRRSGLGDRDDLGA